MALPKQVHMQAAGRAIQRAISRRSLHQGYHLPPLMVCFTDSRDNVSAKPFMGPRGYVPRAGSFSLAWGASVHSGRDDEGASGASWARVGMAWNETGMATFD